MKLYVLRHAEAVDNAPTDSARELTPRGLEQARAVGTFCQRHDLRPDVILTSPFRRAVQTAELCAAAVERVVQQELFLASGMGPASALAELRAYERFSSVMVVGHQPDLGLLVGVLLGLRNADGFPVGKASLSCLEVESLAPGGATLRFALPAQLMT